MRLRSILAGLALSLASIAGVAYASIPLGGSIFPLTLISQPPINLTDGFNEMLMLINQQVVGLSTTYAGAIAVPAAGIDTSPAVFSTNIQQNPLVQDSYTAAFVSTTGNNLNSASYYTLIASSSGRNIIPTGGITIMVSGTAGTATGLAIECEGGGLIASWPTAGLITNVPVTLYQSATSPGTLGKALTQGCGVNNAVYLSNVGTQITTTDFVYVNLPYTVQ